MIVVIAQNIVYFKSLVLWSMDIFFLATKGLMLLCRLNPPEAGKDADKGGRSTVKEMPY